jgi:hypothetical protein
VVIQQADIQSQINPQHLRCLFLHDNFVSTLLLRKETTLCCTSFLIFDTFLFRKATFLASVTNNPVQKPILFDVHCSGNEANIADCQYKLTGICQSDKDVSVTCSRNPGKSYFHSYTRQSSRFLILDKNICSAFWRISLTRLDLYCI